MKLADNIATHPKFYKAGALIGPSGPAQALAMFVAGVGYARTFLTDGFIPREWVGRNNFVTDGKKIAKALSDPRVKLWHKVPGGYRIHDWLDWNDKASEIKKKRQTEAARLRAYRRTRQ